MKDINKILVVKWGALGDLIAGTTAIRSLREAYPDASITVLSNELMKHVCPPGSLIDELIIINPHSGTICEHYKIIKQLRKRKFDAAINLRWTSERSAFLAALSGARYRIGSGPDRVRWIYNRKPPVAIEKKHEFIRHLEIVSVLDIQVSEPKPFVFVSDQDRISAEAFYTGVGSEPGKTLIIHPGASIGSKAWMPERFAETGKRFIKKYQVPVVVTWGAKEENLAKGLVREIGGHAFLAPRTTIGEVAAIIEKSGLCLCNYSGIMNVGMAVNTPLVALGCTNPEEWGPYGSMHRTVNTAAFYDSYTDSERARAMEKISVERVWETLDQRWSELYRFL